jgi:hypothetical protein
MRQGIPSNEVAAKLGLGLILTMAVIGFSSRKQPLNLQIFRKYLFLIVVALAFFLPGIWGFGVFGVADALGAIGGSAWVAAGLGLILVFVASLGSFFVANAHRGAGLIDDEEVAEELRERGQLYFCSFIWMAACGLLLIVLGLAAPGGVLSPAAALAGALVLIAVLAVAGIVAWRLSDELARLSYETAARATCTQILVRRRPGDSPISASSPRLRRSTG